jgi:5-methylthioadenosine/S-adenosylhomocysteine deaminase
MAPWGKKNEQYKPSEIENAIGVVQSRTYEGIIHSITRREYGKLASLLCPICSKDVQSFCFSMRARGEIKTDPPIMNTMENADLLLINAHVLTMDNNYLMFTDGALAIHHGSILQVGPRTELCKSIYPHETIDCRGAIVMPALVNTHTHAPMALLRGLADDLRLDVWLSGYMMPVERRFVNPDFVRLGTRLACTEMIRGGIGTFCDMYYFENEIAAAIAEAGMRGVCSQALMKYPTPGFDSFQDAFDYTCDFLLRWKGHPLITPAVGAHAPYTCTETILRACASLALEHDVPLHIHLAETVQEMEHARRDYGMPEVLYLRNLGVLAAKVVASHCVHIDEEEMRILGKAKVGIAHAPASNLKLASGIARIYKMLEIGLNVGIGTDGAASNNDLDMFEEMRLAALLAKGSSGNPTAVPARTALTMATRMGAHALHIGHRIGSLKPGKRADLLLLDLSEVHSSPKFERDSEMVYPRIVYSAKASDVTDLMVDGKWLMRNRRLQTLAEPGLLSAASEMALQLDAFLFERESSVLSKLTAIEPGIQEDAYEVQAKFKLTEDMPLPELLARSNLTIVDGRHYREHDTYFEFLSPIEGRLRYREDLLLGETGETIDARYRLTLIGPACEREFADAVRLYHSMFLADATHDLRFYREYFHPVREIEVAKERLYWQIRYRNTEFFINFDRVYRPRLPGWFLEVKAQTYSREDAEIKAGMIREIVQLLGLEKSEAICKNNAEIVRQEKID